MTCSVVAGPNASSLQLPVYSGGESHHPDDDRERGASEKEGRRKYILKGQRARSKVGYQRRRVCLFPLKHQKQWNRFIQMLTTN